MAVLFFVERAEGRRRQSVRAGGRVKKYSLSPMLWRETVFSDGQNAENVFRQDHENQIEDPDNIPAEDQSNNSCNDLSFRKARNETADPGSDGDNCQNHADNITQTKIVAFFCHNSISF